MEQTSLLDQVIAFHGHFCPGVLIGYRASLAALSALGVARAADEQLVAIAETDACGVDAVQVVTGCTLGKGNLLLRDWGKQVFSFARRDDPRLLRVALKYEALNRDDDPALPEHQRRALMQQRLQTLPEEDLFAISWVDRPLPSPARLFRTIRCARCGEGVMEARAHLQDGEPLCPECYGPVYSRILG